MAQATLADIHPDILADPTFQAALVGSGAGGQGSLSGREEGSGAVLNTGDQPSGAPPIVAEGQAPAPLERVRAMLGKRLGSASNHIDSTINEVVIGAFTDHASGLTAGQSLSDPDISDPSSTLVSALRDGAMLKNYVVQKAYDVADSIAGDAAKVSMPDGIAGFLAGQGDALKRLGESYVTSHPEQVPGSSSTGLTTQEGEGHPFLGQLMESALASGNAKGTTIGDLVQFAGRMDDLAAHGIASKDDALRSDARSAHIAGFQARGLVDRAVELLGADAKRSYMLAKRLSAIGAQELTAPYIADLTDQVQARSGGGVVLASLLTQLGDGGKAVVRLRDALSTDVPGRSWFAKELVRDLKAAYSTGGERSSVSSGAALSPAAQKLLGLRPMARA